MNAVRRRGITPEQLRAIWTIARSHDVDEDTLRDMVEAASGQRSTRGLSCSQASALLNKLSGQNRRRNKSRYRELDGRPNMATGPQLRAIEAMWASRARAKDKAAALRAWLSNRFGVADLRFLSRSRASDVIVALQKMEEI